MFIVRKEAHGGSVAVFEQWLDCREERGATRSSCKYNEDEHDDNVFSTAMGSSLLTGKKDVFMLPSYPHILPLSRQLTLKRSGDILSRDILSQDIYCPGTICRA